MKSDARKIIDAMSWIQLLSCLDPCTGGLEWARSVIEDKPLTLQDAWDVCPNTGDMVWLMEAILGSPRRRRAFWQSVGGHKHAWEALRHYQSPKSARRRLRHVAMAQGLAIDDLVIREVKRRILPSTDFAGILDAMKAGVRIWAVGYYDYDKMQHVVQLGTERGYTSRGRWRQL